MCLIEEVPSYRYAGKLYATALEATEAAIRETAADLMKNHSGSLAVGLIDKRDEIIELLSAHVRLSPTPISTEVASEKSATTLLVGVFAGHDPSCAFVNHGVDCSCPYGVMTGEQLDEESHSADCMARATGLRASCNCFEK